MKEPNIRLRALELEDLDFLYQIENDDRLWELGVSNVPYSRRVLLDYITSASADIYVDNQVRLIVENEQNEQVVFRLHKCLLLHLIYKNPCTITTLHQSLSTQSLQYLHNALALQDEVADTVMALPAEAF